MSKSSSLIVQSFDYSDFDKETKGKLTYLAGQIRKHAGSHIQEAIRMGEHIAQANDVLAKCGREGKFGDWVKTEFGLSRQAAYNYMNSFERFGDKIDRISHFTAEAIYFLASDKVPESAVKELLKLSDKGVRVNKEVAKKVVEDHTEEPEEATEEPEANCQSLGQLTASESVVDAQAVEPAKPDGWKPPEGVKQFSDTFEVETPESKDAFGDQVSVALEPVFQLCEEFDAQRHKLTGIKSWLTQRIDHPGAVVLKSAAQRLRTAIDEADGELRFSRPHCECVYCRNTPPKVHNCNACKGLGWMTKPVYDAAPKEMKRGKAQG